jgi:hypothetical protein
VSNQKPSTWEVFKSVLASFFGVQSEKIRKRDFEHGSPGQFIVIGLLITLAFIIILYVLVKIILYFILG